MLHVSLKHLRRGSQVYISIRDGFFSFGGWFGNLVCEVLHYVLDMKFALWLIVELECGLCPCPLERRG